MLYNVEISQILTLALLSDEDLSNLLTNKLFFFCPKRGLGKKEKDMEQISIYILLF